MHPKSFQVKLPHELQADEEFMRTRRIASLLSLEALQNDEKWIASKAPPDASEVVAYLKSFGYSASDAQHWRSLSNAPLPQLDINVVEHAEVGDHTWYLIDCSLRTDGIDDLLSWQTARRLCHLRALWYTHVKRELGQAYNRHFSGAHFAHHGAIVGTTARLHAWCKALATCINSGSASPYIVANSLRLLDAPHLLAMEQSLQAADAGVDIGMASLPQAGNGVDPIDVAINMKAEDESSIPAASGPEPALVGRKAVASMISTCIDIDEPQLGTTREEIEP